jgi:hypothetical protein
MVYRRSRHKLRRGHRIVVVVRQEQVLYPAWILDTAQGPFESEVGHIQVGNILDRTMASVVITATCAVVRRY